MTLNDAIVWESLSSACRGVVAACNVYRVGVGEEETSRGCVRKKLAVSAYSAARARSKSCSVNYWILTKLYYVPILVEIVSRTDLTITARKKKCSQCSVFFRFFQRPRIVRVYLILLSRKLKTRTNNSVDRRNRQFDSTEETTPVPGCQDRRISEEPLSWSVLLARINFNSIRKKRAKSRKTYGY